MGSGTEPMRVEGNLATLAAMVRSGTRKAGDALADPAAAKASDLPGSARRIAAGLSSEQADPLREESAAEVLVADLAVSLREAPARALVAQGRLHPDRVRALA